MSSDLFDILFDETERRPLTVTELTTEVRELLENSFASVWVEGEVVNFTAHSSGHWYFNLNDGTSQLKCVCWKGTNFKIRFRPQNGISVRIRGRLSIYQARGEFQLVVESLEPSGEGALAAAFEQIKAKLDGEGLFSPELKRPMPFFPRRVGVVTTKSGAAFHDILNVLNRRSRSVGILLAPATVQGEGAADSVRRALEALYRFSRDLPAAERLDVVIVGRGGGSAEDLWAFNDEQLARAIRSSEIPVISAVGHEIDWTIADLVADARAATPSAAAEMVAAREEDIFGAFTTGEGRILDLIDRRIYEATASTESATDRLENGFTNLFRDARELYSNLSARCTAAPIAAKIAALSNTLDLLVQRKFAAVNAGVDARISVLGIRMAKLDALSPLGVLSRGYSITQDAWGRILRDPDAMNAGDKLKIRLEKGTLDAEVV